MSMPIIQEKPVDTARCSKCGSARIVDDSTRSSGERVCLICGQREYYDLPKVGRVPVYAIRVRYNGPYSNLRGMVITLRVKRAAAGRLRAEEAPSCPWCGQEMEAASLSGKRRIKDERRFRCGQEHRISLLPARDGRIVWR